MGEDFNLIVHVLQDLMERVRCLEGGAPRPQRIYPDPGPEKEAKRDDSDIPGLPRVVVPYVPKKMNIPVGGTRRICTLEDQRLMVKLVSTGRTIQEIADLTKWSDATVANQLRGLGLVAEGKDKYVARSKKSREDRRARAKEVLKQLEIARTDTEETAYV